MIISVASGKGGTGKTTIATNLAVSLDKDVQLLDCDVEEPNCHLFLNPTIKNSVTMTVPVPVVDKNRCNLCGECMNICQFKAIITIGKAVLTFPEMCHSCGGCQKVCPNNAITYSAKEIGVIELWEKNNIDLIHGKLKIGEPMSPPLIKKVKSTILNDKLTIIDAPPGTSCPVISSIKGSDFVLMVTEPTPFGLHDLKLAVETVKYLNLPKGLVINRSDIGDDKVKNYAKQENIPILMEIPFDREIAQLYSNGKILAEEKKEWKEKFQLLYSQVINIIKTQEIYN